MRESIDGTNSATYSYLADSPLVSQIIFAQSGTTRMTTTKQYDYLNRLTSISSANASATVLDSHGYAYNSANQRTRTTNADGTYWVYQYDALGQVVSGVKYWSDGTLVAGQQFGYAFDTIGNRTGTTAGGDNWGQNTRSASYTANTLNQYTSRTVPGAVDITGTATNSATVTVNNQPTTRKGNYYWTPLAINNASSAVWQPVTNLAVLHQGTSPDLADTNLGHVFLPQSPEAYTYDLDGNLTQDGRWTYTWDSENRLIELTSLSTAPAASLLKVDFAYDAKGRRIEKIVSTNDGSEYVPASTNLYVYDGWNLVAEVTPAGSLIRGYTWGLDLSGSMQGAGGVGGLLEISYAGSKSFTCYDGNGNVTALVNASNSTVSANYEYGPFGEVIRESGAMAKSNPIRFSTKYQDDESDYLYYGYRFLNTSTGRWLSRDPIGESGGHNLYAFAGNAPVFLVDLLGLEWQISRNHGARAYAVCAEGDTWDDLAKKVHMDTRDYKKWVKTTDARPNPCKTYTVPNTIIYEYGDYDLSTGIIDLWRANSGETDYMNAGFLVIPIDPTTSEAMSQHMKSQDLYGMVYIGHGECDGSGTIDMGATDYLEPRRYTSYGLAFLTLKACGSADTVTPENGWRYNAWEYNVAKRGRFVGYAGYVDVLNELFQWRTTHGVNKQ